MLSAPVLLGVFIIVLLLIPAIASQLGHWIGWAAVVAAVVALPFSLKVAKAIS